MSAAKKLASVGYSDDTAPRIGAYLASMRPMRGIADVYEDDEYQRGRSLIERLALSSTGQDLPRLQFTKAQCVDVLHFMSFSEPLEPRTWWKDSAGALSHLAGFYFVLGAIEDSLRI